MFETTPHAVKWKTSPDRHGFFEQWTKWHYTEDASFTFCGRPISIGSNHSFLPRTDNDIGKVNCKKCLAAMRKAGISVSNDE